MTSAVRSRLATVLLALSLMLPGAALAACRADTVELRGDFGTARFRVETARTPAERNQGLMYREEMATGAGMLFVYPRAQNSVSFWMRNTLIPLDILFFDRTGTLRTIQAEAKPLDETPLPGGPGIRFVLEINGGLAERMGIEPGALLRSPEVPADLAAWPC